MFACKLGAKCKRKSGKRPIFCMQRTWFIPRVGQLVAPHMLGVEKKILLFWTASFHAKLAGTLCRFFKIPPKKAHFEGVTPFAKSPFLAKIHDFGYSYDAKTRVLVKNRLLPKIEFWPKIYISVNKMVDTGEHNKVPILYKVPIIHHHTKI